MNNKKNIFIVAAVLILLIGIFLRTHNLREWLYFYPDQARDIMLVEEVVEEGGEWPSYGPIAARANFQLGPMHYYFQIISGKLFGVTPEAMAYPDVLFAILSIPLFFYFMSRYFRYGSSLALAGLYSVSFFAVEYSRFAWNPNPIPFFVLLFLISLWKLIFHREKTGWLWITALAAALGAGIQIHTWLLLLMPATLFLGLVFVFRKNQSWLLAKKTLAILVLAATLNAPQIIGEVKNNFTNSGYFWELFAGSSQKGKENFAHYLKLDILNHSQANAHIVSSLGPKLDFKASSAIKRMTKEKNWEKEEYLALGGILASLLFTIFGYAALIYFFIKESDREKKYFLGTVVLYAGLSFLVMHFVMEDLSIRYFIHLVFVPFVFLGFLVKIIKKRFSRKIFPAVAVLFVFLAAANLWNIAKEARAHAQKDRSNERYVVLGEIEPMAEYIISRSPEKTIYFFAQGKYMQNYFKQFNYLFHQSGYAVEKDEDLGSFPSEKKIYMLWHSSRYGPPEYEGAYRVTDQKDFGQVGIYELEKK
ncbi:MAG: hypothetical protein A2288_02100 [Candidatus Moranbacteria bacterium RIFOXYA12_FULL_44_15]|nr:MAG: hypothetical protein A2288_02100 [Candidatus Moranbacteria bacterium RIFOXYA12_FULL_44_15]OGI35896.1 MAG: hypothetical protein A2259_04945 [Candidatus Moranbacteria bacterium RIFOXYA2_FULL_43_15]